MNNQIEITQFEEWKENPATEYFIKYLLDSAKEEGRLLADAIVNGGVIGNDEQIRVSSICVTLTQIADISLEEIQGFYEKED